MANYRKTHISLWTKRQRQQAIDDLVEAGQPNGEARIDSILAFFNGTGSEHAGMMNARIVSIALHMDAKYLLQGADWEKFGKYPDARHEHAGSHVPQAHPEREQLRHGEKSQAVLNALDYLKSHQGQSHASQHAIGSAWEMGTPFGIYDVVVQPGKPHIVEVHVPDDPDRKLGAQFSFAHETGDNQQKKVWISKTPGGPPIGEGSGSAYGALNVQVGGGGGIELEKGETYYVHYEPTQEPTSIHLVTYHN